MSRRAVVAWAFVAVVACGGQVAGGGDGGPTGPGAGTGSSGGSAGSSGGGGSGSGSVGFDSGAQDAQVTVPKDATAKVVCREQGSGGSGGQGSCEVQSTETCSDGTTYSFDCSCPSASCTCTESSANSGSGGGVPLEGCPVCPGPQQLAALWSLCGFPQPQ